MARRRLMLLSLCCLGACVAAYLAWPRASAISAANAARIEPGMSVVEVEAILGGPARDDSTGPLATADSRDDSVGRAELETLREFFISTFPPHSTATSIHREWVSNTVVVRVQFIDGDARTPVCLPVRRVYEGPWTVLRRWLKFYRATS